MNFSKKNHKLVGQNEDIVKKSQKHDANLQKNSTLYFQVGLILTLLATYALFEMEFEIDSTPVVDLILEEDPYVYTAIAIAEIPKPIEKKVAPPKRKTIVDKPIIVDNDASLKDADPFITELPVDNTPTIDPGEVIVEKKPEITRPLFITGVEQVPIYPGCEGLSNNKDRLDCMSGKLKKLISRKFDTDIVDELGLSKRQRIYVNFRIDKSGQIQDIQARSPHSRLQKEAIKVANKIPQMTPAKQSNKNVDVMYTLPITIQVQN